MEKINKLSKKGGKNLAIYTEIVCEFTFQPSYTTSRSLAQRHCGRQNSKMAPRFSGLKPYNRYRINEKIFADVISPKLFIFKIDNQDGPDLIT